MVCTLLYMPSKSLRIHHCTSQIWKARWQIRKVRFHYVFFMSYSPRQQFLGPAFLQLLKLPSETPSLIRGGQEEGAPELLPNGVTPKSAEHPFRNTRMALIVFLAGLTSCELLRHASANDTNDTNDT